MELEFRIKICNSLDSITQLTDIIIIIPSHCYGEHKKCFDLSYFCFKTAADEHNLFPDLAAANMTSKIIEPFYFLANQTKILSYVVNNKTVEELNSVI